MNAVIERINSFGIPIGEEARPAQTLQALRDRGIYINYKTIARLIDGSTNGEKILRKLQCAETLERDSVCGKDRFYLRIIEIGLNKRARQSKEDAHKWNSHQFMGPIVDNTGIDPQILRRCFRGMRAEMVFSEIIAMTDHSKPTFLQAADQYIQDYTGSRCGHYSPFVNQVAEKWDGTTIESFYRGFYDKVQTPNTLGTWPPYEAEALRDFYKDRIAAGSPLTILDRLILNTERDDSLDRLVPQAVADWTGVRFDPTVTYNHLNVLLTGRP